LSRSGCGFAAHPDADHAAVVSTLSRSRPNLGVVDHERPDNPLMEWAALALLVADIHDLEDHEYALDDLLTEFERVAWPSPRAQSQ
jgi:hypothetical protein